MFDARTGERVARDYEDDWPGYDPLTLHAEGIGPLAGVSVPQAGMAGGGLPVCTSDGWHLDVMAIWWPVRHVLLSRLFGAPPSPGGGSTVVAEDGACTLRAAGFSPTGRTAAVATSCDLMLFARDGTAAPGDR